MPPDVQKSALINLRQKEEEIELNAILRLIA